MLGITDDTINTYRANNAALLISGLEATINVAALEREIRDTEDAIDKANNLLMDLAVFKAKIDRILL